MKKYLYVLKVKSQAFIIFENEKIKYFEEDEKIQFENLQKYLQDKVSFKGLTEGKEKKIQYYGEEYIVKIINMEEFAGVIDSSSIREVNNMQIENLSYRDMKLLDLFFIYGFSAKKVKDISISEEEKKMTMKNFYISLVIAILTSIFYMTGNRINYLGISYPIIAFMIAVGGIYTIEKVKKVNYLGLYFIIVAITLSMTYGIFTNLIFKVINFILIPFALAIGLYLINYNDEDFEYLNFIYNILPNITVDIFNNKPFLLLKRLLIKVKVKKAKDSKTKSIQKGILISIPLLVVLIALLSSADPIFGEIFKNIGLNLERLLLDIKIDGFIAKFICLAVVFSVLYCFLGRLKFKEINKVKEIKRYFNINTVNTVLIMVNILYAFFTIVQIKYLFVRYSGNLSAEMYSDYAREGFFQLVIVVIINIFIILISQNRVELNKITKILNTIMTVMSISMTISSMHKMNLYINRYGLTRLRFMTSIFMIFILVSLVFIAVSLWKNINLFKYVILVGSILYVLMNFVNMDRCIASYNLNNKQIKMDVNYLTELSKDSSEVMKKAYKDGKIDSKTYNQYISKNKTEKDYKWFEYNFYNNKKLS